jgi:hypothetical protein
MSLYFIKQSWLKTPKQAHGKYRVADSAPGAIFFSAGDHQDEHYVASSWVFQQKRCYPFRCAHGFAR